jgi:uracil phosphoribosyltransferase
MNKNVFLIDHPLMQHKLTFLRNKQTNTKEFREIVKEVTTLMVYEIFRNVQLKDVEIETPIAKTIGKSMTDEVAVIPILRAGLVMEEGILELIPNAKVGHIGIYRDPESLEPVEYYCKLPKDLDQSSILIVDPMLATGGSAAKAIELVKKAGGKDIKLVCLISAPPGIEKVTGEHPDVKIYTISIDPELNSHGYIVPGLGDAGDRLFGTK